MLDSIGNDCLASPDTPRDPEPSVGLSTRGRVALVLCFFGAVVWVGYAVWTVIVAVAAEQFVR